MASCNKCGLDFRWCPCTRAELSSVRDALDDVSSRPSRPGRVQSAQAKLMVADWLSEAPARIEAAKSRRAITGCSDSFTKLVGQGLVIPGHTRLGGKDFVEAALRPLGNVCPKCKTVVRQDLQFFYEYGRDVALKAYCDNCVHMSDTELITLRHMTRQLEATYRMLASLATTYKSEVPRYTSSRVAYGLEDIAARKILKSGRTTPCIGYWTANASGLFDVIEVKHCECYNKGKPGWERVIGGATHFVYSKQGLQCSVCSVYTPSSQGLSKYFCATMRKLKQRLVVEGLRYAALSKTGRKETSLDYAQETAIQSGAVLSSQTFYKLLGISVDRSVGYSLPWVNWHTGEVEYTEDIAGKLFSEV